MARKAKTDPNSDAPGKAPGISDAEPTGALTAAGEAVAREAVTGEAAIGEAATGGAGDPVASGPALPGDAEVAADNATPAVPAPEGGAQKAAPDARPDADAPVTASDRAAPDAAPWTPRAPQEALDAAPEPRPSADQIEDTLLAGKAGSAPEDKLTASSTTVAAAPAPRRPVLPMVLAGVVTAGLGLGAGWALWAPGGPLSGSSELEQRLADLESRLTAASSLVTEANQTASATSALMVPLDERLGSAEAALQALQGLTGSVEAIQSVSGQQASALMALEQKLTDLAQRPPESDPAAVAVYERELSALRQTFTAELAAIRSSSDQALSEIRTTLSSELTRLEQESEQVAAQANEAAARQAEAELAASVAALSAAIDAGTALEAPLAELAAQNPGLPLGGFAAFPEGVPTLLALQQAFPPAARAALAADIAAGSGEGGFGGTLKSFFGVRSLAPQDGTTTDAILSRAEAALSAGDLAAALDQLAQLAPTPAAETQAWRELAAQRLAALAAFKTLSDAVEK